MQKCATERRSTNIAASHPAPCRTFAPPPNWLFAPVWTVLYASMEIAAWLVWERAGLNAAPVLVLFAIQLVVNAAGTWLFFGLDRADRALIDIAALWALIAATLAAFWQIDARAGFLLVPYLAWVTFAMALNRTIWRLNN